MATCSNGHEVLDGAKFCPECGSATVPTTDDLSQVTTADTSSSDKAPASWFRRHLKFLLPAAVAVVALAIAVPLVLSHGNGGPSSSDSNAATDAIFVAQEVNYCAIDLSDFAIEMVNGNELGVITTFGQQSVVFVDIENDFRTYEPALYRVGQTQAQSSMYTSATAQCEKLPSQGIAINRLPRADNYTNNSDGSSHFPQAGNYILGNTGNTGTGNTGNTGTASGNSGAGNTGTTTGNTPASNSGSNSASAVRGTTQPQFSSYVNEGLRQALVEYFSAAANSGTPIDELFFTAATDTADPQWAQYCVGPQPAYASSIQPAGGLAHELANGSWTIVTGPGTAGGVVPGMSASVTKWSQIVPWTTNNNCQGN